MNGESTAHVREALTPFGAGDRIIELDVSSATVELAAEALHCEGARIAKTLSFMADGKPLLIVLAGDARVDNAKYKHFFGCKARMMTAQELEDCTGLHFGGVCPFGIPKEVTIYLDDSLKRFTTVYPACGTASSAIEVTLEELERFSSAAGWIDVSK